MNTEVPMQQPSLDIWDSKYRLKDLRGNSVDQDIDATFRRVAWALAEAEKEDMRDHWYQKFLWALRNGAVPAGRVLSNAGAGEYKPAVSAINCTVSETIRDSMESILTAAKNSGMTLKAGCGIGYEFSTLRPRGAQVAGAGATTSGPLTFMDVFDKLCFTVSSAGGRRGAQMGTFDVGHPDVMEFIKAKREDGRLRQFNLSLLITDEFMQAVADNADWELSFPVLHGETFDTAIYRDWPVIEDDYIVNEDGKVLCKVYGTVKASDLWDTIMKSTYDYAEPGFLLVDHINQMNNLWFCENIRATNPCGEQPLPPYGACLLGSVNLTQFVLNPFSRAAKFDWDKYREVVRVFTRMLDNVVEINGLPLEQQRCEIFYKRRHGMGFLGLGSAMAMLGMTYGDEDSVLFTENVSRELAIEGWKVGLELAKEKGPAHVMTDEFELTPRHFRLQPKLAGKGYKVGDKVPGRVLFALSNYMAKVQQAEPELVAELAKHGSRFSHHSSIAPTGTISLSIGNNASNGIEPSFSHRYFRNVIRQGCSTKEQIEVVSYELAAYRCYVDPKATDKDLPKNCVTSETITPKQHVDIQAAAQAWVDSSISKTVNVPTDFPFEEFKGLYRYAYEKGLKGCTTFRFNPEAFSGVLVREDDLKNTVYEFELDNGEVLTLRGDEKVFYEGREHVVANLFDALKEGYYGKH